MASGGFGYSSAQMFPALKAMAAGTGLDLLEFSTASVSVRRGTYTKKAVCIKPAEGNFKADVDVSVSGSTFKINPTKLSAKMGAKEACADMGTASTTQMSTHFVRWTVNNGTKSYTALPTLKAMVNGKKADVNAASEVTCSLGGSSVPIVVTASAVPFSEIKVSLETSTVKDGTTTKSESTGITPGTEVVTLKVGSDSGVLGFKCAATVTGTKLKYKLDGADKLVFNLATALDVKPVKAGTKPAAPKMTLAMVDASSKAA